LKDTVLSKGTEIEEQTRKRVVKKKLLLLLAATLALAIPACAWQEKAQDFGVVTFKEDTTLPTETPFGKKTKSPHK
jgi:hypothetical protein